MRKQTSDRIEIYQKNKAASILINILKFDPKSADFPRRRTEFVNPISL